MDNGDNTLDHNLCYNSTLGKIWTIDGGSSYTEPGDVFTDLGQEEHSLDVDPLFTNAATFNMTLGSGSPAIEAGTVTP